jgi:hypothetical protein
MQNYPIAPQEFYYLRLYREQGKLRLEVLREAMSNPSKEPVKLEIVGGDTHRAVINVYFDNLEVDFEISEALAHKIYDYFKVAWHKPIKPDYL